MPRIDSTLNKLREALPTAFAYAEAALNDVDFGNTDFAVWWETARKDIPDEYTGLCYSMSHAAWAAADHERRISQAKTMERTRERVPALLALKIHEAKGALTARETARQFDVREEDVWAVWGGLLWPSATGVEPLQRRAS